MADKSTSGGNGTTSNDSDVLAQDSSDPDGEMPPGSNPRAIWDENQKAEFSHEMAIDNGIKEMGRVPPSDTRSQSTTDWALIDPDEEEKDVHSKAETNEDRWDASLNPENPDSQWRCGDGTSSNKKVDLGSTEVKKAAKKAKTDDANGELKIDHLNESQAERLKKQLNNEGEMLYDLAVEAKESCEDEEAEYYLILNTYISKKKVISFFPLENF